MGNANRKEIEALIKGQVLIEFVLMFVAVALFLLGATRLWIFFNANFANRQPSYQDSRTKAGTPDKNNYDLVWPPPEYEELELTEEWILKGEPRTKDK